MKNLFLTILLLPTLLFGQDLRLDHSVIQTAPYSVGDTITIKFNTVDVNSTIAVYITAKRATDNINCSQQL